MYLPQCISALSLRANVCNLHEPYTLYLVADGYCMYMYIRIYTYTRVVVANLHILSLGQFWQIDELSGAN